MMRANLDQRRGMGLGLGIVCAVLLDLTACQAQAEEPWGLKLMRPDSLVAWDYGAEEPAGWTIARGRLSGTEKSTPLLSGFSFGDVELRFRFSLAEGARWHVQLPEVPAGKGLEIILCEGDGCGRVLDGGQQLAPGKRLAARPQDRGQATHSAAIQRAAGKLKVTVDGQTRADVAVAPKRRFGLGLALTGGRGSIEELRAREPLGESLIGSDLGNWWTPGDMSKWAVEDGQIVRMERAGNYLRTKREYGNFTLSLSMLMKERTNSGLGIRTPHDGWPSSDGIELQWLDRPGTAGTGANLALYGNVPPLDNVYRSGEWNDLVVKADGFVISAWQNGELVQHCNTFHHPELKHRNLRGWIGFQDHGGWVRVRDAYVLEAPDGTGLDAWKQPRPRLAGGLLIDRLMNPETVIAPDGTRSGVVSVELAGGRHEEPENHDDQQTATDQQAAHLPGEQTVAELCGPAAVVRVAWQGEPGRLAFYFDGEPKPRIDCRADELRSHVPPFVQNSPPLLTCLAFKQSLRITARESGQARLRIDYVTFASDCTLPDDRNPAALFPRGWLVALGYHRHKYGWSARRQFEPLEHRASKPRTLAAGERASLLRVPEAGTVVCLRLRAEEDPLAHDDLWLEVCYDGHREPDLAAPVRFWFPGLVGAGSYENFVLVRQNGVANTLAMPFGRGIELRAHNRGDKPAKGLVVELTVQRPAAEHAEQTAALVNGPRLKGVFLSAGEQTDLLTCCQCPGRWVGLVCEEPPDGAHGIEGLLIDGRPAAGWQMSDLDLLLGRSGQFRAALSGRAKGLAWRYLLLAPVDFERSIELKTKGGAPGDRLGLFYVREP